MTATATRSGLVTVFFNNGRYPMRLRIGELISLQETLGCGPSQLLDRLRSGSWGVRDIIETIRLGLCGGGMGQEQAFDLVNRTVRDGYILEYLPTAFTVILAALTGAVDDPIEEDDDAGEQMAPAASTVGAESMSSAEPPAEA